MKAKIYVNNFDSILFPNKEQELKKANLNLENLIKAKPIPAELMEVIDNEAKDNAIIKILRVMKKPDDPTKQLTDDNSNLRTQINNINKSVTLSKAQRNANIKTIKNINNQINANLGKINEYNNKLKAYNVISSKITKLNEYFTNTFGTYYLGSKKEELDKKINDVNYVVQEYYQDVNMIPLNHIGIM